MLATSNIQVACAHVFMTQWQYQNKQRPSSQKMVTNTHSVLLVIALVFFTDIADIL